MKQRKPETITNKRVHAVLAIALVALLSACGSGSGSTAGESAPTEVTDGNTAARAVSYTESTVTVSKATTQATGAEADVVTVTVQLKDASGTNLTDETGTLVFDSPSYGRVESVAYQDNGRYTARYVPLGAPGQPVVLRANLDGVGLKQTTEVTIEPTDFYLAGNGVTVKCEGAAQAATGTVNGVAYTRRNQAALEGLTGDVEAQLGQSCISGVQDLSGLGLNGPSLNPDIASWDTSNATKMHGELNGNFLYGLFDGNISFDRDISGWDVGRVTTFARMFAGASSFNANLAGWDTSGATEPDAFKQTFQLATAFNNGCEAGVTTCPLDAWSTGLAEDFSSMFDGASSFNQSVNGWNVSSAKNMNSMFSGASAFNQSLDRWNTSSVTDMEAMFKDAASFNGDVSNWQTGSVTTFNEMFMNATRFNRSIAGWNRSGTGLTEGAGGPLTDAQTAFQRMFKGALAFDQDLSNWDYRKYCDPAFSEDANADWSQAHKPQFNECPS